MTNSFGGRRSLEAIAAGLAIVLVGCADIPVSDGVEIGGGVDLPGHDSDDDGRDSDDGGHDRGTGGGEGGDDTGGPGAETGSTGEPADDGPSGPPTCEEQSFQFSVEQPQVVLLLDKSHSMVDNQWDHDGDPSTPMVTRWDSLYHAVDMLVHVSEEGIELGMVLFPSVQLVDNDAATACIVDPMPHSPVGPLNGSGVVNALPGPDALDLYGGTPVSGGLTVVFDHLEEIEDGRPQAVVLVTDGAANCMAGTDGNQVFTEYDANLAPMVAGAFAAGISTYVVGVDILDEVGLYPADNPYVRLNELALAGGVPRIGPEAFYNTSDEHELSNALDQIASKLSCTLELDTPAEFSGQVTVTVAGEAVERVGECLPNADGWRYLQDSAPYSSIELCAATCSDAHAQAQIDIEYACVPQG